VVANQSTQHATNSAEAQCVRRANSFGNTSSQQAAERRRTHKRHRVETHHAAAFVFFTIVYNTVLLAAIWTMKPNPVATISSKAAHGTRVNEKATRPS
jgi:hypothetical protein